MSALLEVRDLHVSYGPVNAVRGVDLSVAPGDVLALLGPNGAGKSSMLRAISGLEPYRGSVRYDGIEAADGSVTSLARRGLIHVPEGRRIFPTLTVHENLQVSTAARGRRSADFTPEDVYDLFPLLAHLRDRDGWALSGGEQQMLALGRALVGAPRLLLLDEPSLGLAPSIVDTVFEALLTLAERVPMLLVEQNTQVALDVASRAMVLSEGRVVLQGSPEELLNRAELVDSYLGQADTLRSGPDAG